MSSYIELNNNHVKVEYSLTKHLNTLCSQDEKYKDLYAVWTLDQEIYSKALTTVALSFPHYSTHDSSHSSSIINKIEMLLGEDRIRSLSPTDTFMILESAYLHDFGMIIANSELVEEWGKPSFKRFLKSLRESTYDEDVARAANYILEIQEKEVNFKDNSKWPIEVKNCVTIISAEYFRKRHNIRSANWIEKPEKLGININFNKLIPERIMRLIGKIAISHGTSFESTFDSLEQIANGIGTDRIHPRFIACFLRLGDLLDLDNGRFNPVAEKVSEFPKSSMLHKDKHASITHFLVCPQRIEVSAICKDDKVYRVTREWFDCLKEEMKNLSSRWSEIVPKDFQGGPPSLGDIKLSIENSEKITEQLDLRFSIDQERAFELIEGSGIYDSELIFIREMIQNALDATKMQLWKDITSKKYDNISLVKCADRKISDEKDKLFFYDDIPKEIRALYPINIEITYQEPEKVIEAGYEYEKEGQFIFKIEDRGCGISLNDLKRMENVGGSWSQDEALADFIENMPAFLKPTGNFGMGLHSVFMITDEMEINTKSEDDKAYNINFVSRRKNGYIAVKENKDRRNIGTEITIEIKETRLKQAIENLTMKIWPNRKRNMFDRYKEYDCLSEQYEVNNTLSKLAAYINYYIKNVRMFNIGCSLNEKTSDIFKINKEKNLEKTEENNKQLRKYDDSYNEKGLKYDIYFDSCGVLTLKVRDQRTSAYIVFRANTTFKIYNDQVYIDEDLNESYKRICFKEIECSEEYIKQYFSVDVNIYAGEAKTVLDVAREELKPSIKDFYSKRVDEIFKDSLYKIKKYLDEHEDSNKENKKIKERIEEKIKQGRNYYEQSMFLFRLAYRSYTGETFECQWGNDFIINGYYRLDKGDNYNKKVLYKEFEHMEKVFICEDNPRFTDKDERVNEYIRNTYDNCIVTDSVLYNFEYEYIFKNFRVEKYKTICDEKIIILKKDNEDDEKSFFVEKNSEEYKTLLHDLIDRYYIRSMIYPIKRIEKSSVYECLVLNEVPKDMNIARNLELFKYFIISPLINIDIEYRNKNIDELIVWLKKEAGFDKLVRLVVMYSVQNKDKNIKESEAENHKDLIEEVENAYKLLIEEYLELINEPENKQVELNFEMPIVKDEVASDISGEEY